MGCSHFARRYSGNRVFFLFLEVLRCFSSLGLLSSKRVIGLASDRVSPFGHPGINACVPLPLAYRSLPRPSSPPCAQASPTCFRSLDYKAVCVKQSTRDLTDSSDNPYETDEIESLSTKIHKSAIYQSFRCQTAPTRRVRRSSGAPASLY